MSDIMSNFKRYNPIGGEEKSAVMRVLDSGNLSSFIGSWGDDFYGGEEVQEFEKEIASYFNVKYAITFNSLTSGLIAAVGAIGIEPGDEVIVSPWTMSATATAILIWGGIPIFVDIEDEYYGLDPLKVESAITEYTRAIIVTNIFGHGAKLQEISEIANRNNLKLIEDSAQAPGANYKSRFCGTWGDIGGFSLNYHKHIHTGEGGFCITDDENYALKMRMIRNHAEASIVGSPLKELRNMIGFNFRMGEMEAAIGREQLKKLPKLLTNNISKAIIVNNILSEIDDFILAEIAEGSSHIYYVLPINIKRNMERRKPWLENLCALGLPGLMAGYVNVHRLPMYQQKIAFGKSYPWSMAHRDISYDEGICPNAELLMDTSFVGFIISMYEISEEECEFIANTMVREWKNLS